MSEVERVCTGARRFAVAACAVACVLAGAAHSAPSAPPASMPGSVPTPEPDLPAGHPARPDPSALRPPAVLSSLEIEIAPDHGDLDAIVARRQVRMLVTHDRTHFHFDGGRQAGIVADAIVQFERWLNADLKRTRRDRIHAIVVPVPRHELIPALLAGRGDVIAMPLTETPERRRDVAFADGGRRIDEVLVTRRDARAPGSVDALSGLEVHVRRGSSYHESLVALNETFRAAGRPPVEIRLLPDDLDPDEALEMVNAGVIPATVVDSYIARAWSRRLPEIRVDEAIVLRSGAPSAWAVRKDNEELLAVVSRFARAHGPGTLWGNMKAREHFGAGDPIRNPGAAAERARLDEVRGLMQRYASSYSLDWLLLAAQAFQESGLDHSRRSHVGAIGIMQLMPATARDPRVGIPDIEKLDRNIEAGTKYLRFVIDRYYAQQPMTDLDKALFALASYNAGPARVAKLRQEAAKSGLDPNVWFGHVEVVAARRIGAETVDYVRNIYKYYLAYRLLEDQHRSRGTVASARTT